jgi:hypothetical protein
MRMMRSEKVILIPLLAGIWDNYTPCGGIRKILSSWESPAAGKARVLTK